MNIHRIKNHPLGNGLYSLALVLAAAACALNCGPDNDGQGSSTDSSETEGGAASNAGADSGGAPTAGKEGSEPSASGASGIGGGPALEGGRASGGGPAEPGASGSGAGGHVANGGSPAVAGTTSDAGSPAEVGGSSSEPGGNDAGGAGEGGAGDEPEVAFDSICFDEFGETIPYDFSFGLASEYAFELSMNCDLGGHVLPLVMADPEQLSAVTAFVAEATTWYRSAILRCDGEPEVDAAEYGLLPRSEDTELSRADFDVSSNLFFSIIDRHDSQPDAVHPNKKNKIKERIKSLKAKAVTKHTDELTKPLSEPECVPSPPSGG